MKYLTLLASLVISSLAVADRTIPFASIVVNCSPTNVSGLHGRVLVFNSGKKNAEVSLAGNLKFSPTPTNVSTVPFSMGPQIIKPGETYVFNPQLGTTISTACDSASFYGTLAVKGNDNPVTAAGVFFFGQARSEYVAAPFAIAGGQPF